MEKRFRDPGEYKVYGDGGEKPGISLRLYGTVAGIIYEGIRHS